jgi:hypothetical protein
MRPTRARDFFERWISSNRKFIFHKPFGKCNKWGAHSNDDALDEKTHQNHIKNRRDNTVEAEKREKNRIEQLRQNERERYPERKRASQKAKEADIEFLYEIESENRREDDARRRRKNGREGILRDVERGWGIEQVNLRGKGEKEKREKRNPGGLLGGFFAKILLEKVERKNTADCKNIATSDRKPKKRHLFDDKEICKDALQSDERDESAFSQPQREQNKSDHNQNMREEY